MKKGAGNIGGNADSCILRCAKLRNQSVIGRAVGRHKQVKQKQCNKQPEAVDRRNAVHRRPEDKHGDQSERHCDFSHERNSAASGILRPVRQIGNQRIRDRVKDTAERGNRADDCRDAEDYAPLRYEERLPLRDGILRRLIEVDQPVGDQSRQNRPAELSDRKAPHFPFCKFFHVTPPHACV